MNDWADVLAHACALPGVEMSPYYGTPCPKVNGKAFAAPGHEDGSFCLFSTRDEKLMLMETDPDTFWQTPHYANYPALLVRYGTPARDRIAMLLERAWWDRATKAQRQGFGDRP